MSNDWFDSATKHRFLWGSKFAIIAMMVVIFAVVLTWTRWLLTYIFVRARYLEHASMQIIKRIVVGAIILITLTLVILATIYILWQIQVNKEHKE